jgi:HK97 family phage prohead protease
MDFIICTEDINRYGFRILLSGLRLDNFRKNPVMLYDHRTYSYMPIGKWDNLRIKDNKLIATAVFADGDEEASRVKNLVEQGVLSATSVGFETITVSTDQEYLLAGQTRATIVEAELLEVSITPIPANANAVRLSANGAEFLPPVISHSKEVEMNFEKIALQLGLPKDATEQQIVDTISAIQKDNIDNVLQLGVDRGVITAERRPHFEALAKADLKTTKSLILSLEKVGGPDDTTETEKEEDAQQERQLTLAKVLKLSGSQNQKEKDPNDRSGWDYDKWSKEDSKGLLEMKRKEPARYEELALAYANAV